MPPLSSCFRVVQRKGKVKYASSFIFFPTFLAAPSHPLLNTINNEGSETRVGETRLERWVGSEEHLLFFRGFQISVPALQGGHDYL